MNYQEMREALASALYYTPDVDGFDNDLDMETAMRFVDVILDHPALAAFNQSPENLNAASADSSSVVPACGSSEK